MSSEDTYWMNRTSFMSDGIFAPLIKPSTKRHIDPSTQSINICLDILHEPFEDDYNPNNIVLTHHDQSQSSLSETNLDNTKCQARKYPDNTCDLDIIVDRESYSLNSMYNFSISREVAFRSESSPLSILDSPALHKESSKITQSKLIINANDIPGSSDILWFLSPHKHDDDSDKVIITTQTESPMTKIDPNRGSNTTESVTTRTSTSTTHQDINCDNKYFNTIYIPPRDSSIRGTSDSLCDTIYPSNDHHTSDTTSITNTSPHPQSKDKDHINQQSSHVRSNCSNNSNSNSHSSSISGESVAYSPFSSFVYHASWRGSDLIYSSRPFMQLSYNSIIYNVLQLRYQLKYTINHHILLLGIEWYLRCHMSPYVLYPLYLKAYNLDKCITILPLQYTSIGSPSHLSSSSVLSSLSLYSCCDPSTQQPIDRLYPHNLEYVLSLSYNQLVMYLFTLSLYQAPTPNLNRTTYTSQSDNSSHNNKFNHQKHQQQRHHRIMNPSASHRQQPLGEMIASDTDASHLSIAEILHSTSIKLVPYIYYAYYTIMYPLELPVHQPASLETRYNMAYHQRKCHNIDDIINDDVLSPSNRALFNRNSTINDDNNHGEGVTTDTSLLENINTPHSIPLWSLKRNSHDNDSDTTSSSLLSQAGGTIPLSHHFSSLPSLPQDMYVHIIPSQQRNNNNDMNPLCNIYNSLLSPVLTPFASSHQHTLHEHDTQNTTVLPHDFYFFHHNLSTIHPSYDVLRRPDQLSRLLDWSESGYSHLYIPYDDASNHISPAKHHAEYYAQKISSRTSQNRKRLSSHLQPTLPSHLLHPPLDAMDRNSIKSLHYSSFLSGIDTSNTGSINNNILLTKYCDLRSMQDAMLTEPVKSISILHSKWTKRSHSHQLKHPDHITTVKSIISENPTVSYHPSLLQPGEIILCNSDYYWGVTMTDTGVIDSLRSLLTLSSSSSSDHQQKLKRDSKRNTNNCKLIPTTTTTTTAIRPPPSSSLFQYKSTPEDILLEKCSGDTLLYQSCHIQHAIHTFFAKFRYHQRAVLTTTQDRAKSVVSRDKEESDSESDSDNDAIESHPTKRIPAIPTQGLSPWTTPSELSQAYFSLAKKNNAKGLYYSYSNGVSPLLHDRIGMNTIDYAAMMHLPQTLSAALNMYTRHIDSMPLIGYIGAYDQHNNIYNQIGYNHKSVLHNDISSSRKLYIIGEHLRLNPNKRELLDHVYCITYNRQYINHNNIVRPISMLQCDSSAVMATAAKENASNVPTAGYKIKQVTFLSLDPFKEDTLNQIYTQSQSKSYGKSRTNATPTSINYTHIDGENKLVTENIYGEYINIVTNNTLHQTWTWRTSQQIRARQTAIINGEAIPEVDSDHVKVNDSGSPQSIDDIAPLKSKPFVEWRPPGFERENAMRSDGLAQDWICPEFSHLPSTFVQDVLTEQLQSVIYSMIRGREIYNQACSQIDHINGKEANNLVDKSPNTQPERIVSSQASIHLVPCYIKCLSNYLNAARYRHWTALTLAASGGNIHSVPALLRLGLCDVLMQGGCGHTPLACSVKWSVRNHNTLLSNHLTMIQELTSQPLILSMQHTLHHTELRYIQSRSSDHRNKNNKMNDTSDYRDSSDNPDSIDITIPSTMKRSYAINLGSLREESFAENTDIQTTTTHQSQHIHWANRLGASPFLIERLMLDPLAQSLVSDAVYKAVFPLIQHLNDYIFPIDSRGQTPVSRVITSLSIQLAKLRSVKPPIVSSSSGSLHGTDLINYICYSLNTLSNLDHASIIDFVMPSSLNGADTVPIASSLNRSDSPGNHSYQVDMESLSSSSSPSIIPQPPKIVLSGPLSPLQHNYAINMIKNYSLIFPDMACSIHSMNHSASTPGGPVTFPHALPQSPLPPLPSNIRSNSTTPSFEQYELAQSPLARLLSQSNQTPEWLLLQTVYDLFQYTLSLVILCLIEYKRDIRSYAMNNQIGPTNPGLLTTQYYTTHTNNSNKKTYDNRILFYIDKCIKHYHGGLLSYIIHSAHDVDTTKNNNITTLSSLSSSSTATTSSSTTTTTSNMTTTTPLDERLPHQTSSITLDTIISHYNIHKSGLSDKNIFTLPLSIQLISYLAAVPNQGYYIPDTMLAKMPNIAYLALQQGIIASNKRTRQQLSHLLSKIDTTATSQISRCDGLIYKHDDSSRSLSNGGPIILHVRTTSPGAQASLPQPLPSAKASLPSPSPLLLTLPLSRPSSSSLPFILLEEETKAIISSDRALWNIINISMSLCSSPSSSLSSSSQHDLDTTSTAINTSSVGSTIKIDSSTYKYPDKTNQQQQQQHNPKYADTASKSAERVIWKENIDNWWNDLCMLYKDINYISAYFLHDYSRIMPSLGNGGGEEQSSERSTNIYTTETLVPSQLENCEINQPNPLSHIFKWLAEVTPGRTHKSPESPNRTNINTKDDTAHSIDHKEEGGLSRLHPGRWRTRRSLETNKHPDIKENIATKDLKLTASLSLNTDDQQSACTLPLRPSSSPHDTPPDTGQQYNDIDPSSSSSSSSSPRAFYIPYIPYIQPLTSILPHCVEYRPHGLSKAVSTPRRGVAMKDAITIPSTTRQDYSSTIHTPRGIAPSIAPLASSSPIAIKDMLPLYRSSQQWLYRDKQGYSPPSHHIQPMNSLHHPFIPRDPLGLPTSMADASSSTSHAHSEFDDTWHTSHSHNQISSSSRPSSVAITFDQDHGEIFYESKTIHHLHAYFDTSICLMQLPLRIRHHWSSSIWSPLYHQHHCHHSANQGKELNSDVKQCHNNNNKDHHDDYDSILHFDDISSLSASFTALTLSSKYDTPTASITLSSSHSEDKDDNSRNENTDDDNNDDDDDDDDIRLLELSGKQSHYRIAEQGGISTLSISLSTSSSRTPRKRLKQNQPNSTQHDDDIELDQLLPLRSISPNTATSISPSKHGPPETHHPSRTILVQVVPTSISQVNYASFQTASSQSNHGNIPPNASSSSHTSFAGSDLRYHHPNHHNRQAKHQITSKCSESTQSLHLYTASNSHEISRRPSLLQPPQVHSDDTPDKASDMVIPYSKSSNLALLPHGLSSLSMASHCSLTATSEMGESTTSIKPDVIVIDHDNLNNTNTPSLLSPLTCSDTPANCRDEQPILAIPLMLEQSYRSNASLGIDHSIKQSKSPQESARNATVYSNQQDDNTSTTLVKHHHKSFYDLPTPIIDLVAMYASYFDFSVDIDPQTGTPLMGSNDMNDNDNPSTILSIPLQYSSDYTYQKYPPSSSSPSSSSSLSHYNHSINPAPHHHHSNKPPLVHNILENNTDLFHLNIHLFRPLRPCEGGTCPCHCKCSFCSEI